MLYKMQSMMKTRLTLFTLLLLLATTFLAQADGDHDEAKRLKEAGEIVALEIILKNARQIQQGKILEAELETENGKLIYEIELLTQNGTVFELLFDAKTGTHLSTEIED